MTATLMSEVCHNVKIEPGLQPVTGEQFEHRTANREDGARLDIVAQSFWGRNRQSAFLMLGYLTHTHLAIATPPRPNAIERMS